MEWYHVYLFTRLDGLSSAGAWAFGLGVAALIASAIGGHEAADWERMFGKGCNTGWITLFTRMFKIALAMVVVGGLLTLFTPTQKEAAAICLLPKLAKSDFAKEAGQIPADAAKLMRLKLESWIADMEPAAKK